MDSVGKDAKDPIGSGLPAGPNNTTTALVEPESGHKTTDNGCYAFYVGTLGNFSYFPGSIEQTTADNFTTSSQNVRCDFYQLLSTSPGPGTYLGYFEFATNGVMTYTAGPFPVVGAPPCTTSLPRPGT